MLLLIDIGNTNTTIGFHDNGEIRNILHFKTISGGRNTEEYSYILEGVISTQKLRKPGGAALCSVVPDVTPFITNALKKSFDLKPFIVNHDVNTGLEFLVKNVTELGADRIANAVAAYKRYKRDVIIIDFGTATTFCAVTEKGEYTGGAIMPGIALWAHALAEKTAKLPVISLRTPDSILGKNTRENIRSGVILGHAGAVERIIHDISEETGKEYTVLATGGLADLVTPYIKRIDHINPLLTLEGLRLIHEMNS
jgi:type III pantothenate kinase